MDRTRARHWTLIEGTRPPLWTRRMKGRLLVASAGGDETDHWHWCVADAQTREWRCGGEAEDRSAAQAEAEFAGMQSLSELQGRSAVESL